MMKVTLLIVSCLAYFAAAQNTFGFNTANTASCNTAGGCSLSSILDATALVNIVSNLLGIGYTLDLSQLSSGAVVNIDATGAFQTNNNLYVTALNTGNAVVNIASGITINAANLAVQAGSNVYVNGNVLISNAAANATSVTVAATSTLYVNANAGINAGASTVQASGNAVVAGTITAATYTQSSASLILNSTANAVVVAASTINVNSGATISGNGAIGSSSGTGASATLYVSGTVSVGNSPGTVTVNGDWRPSASATYQFEAANSASYDRLIVSGKAYFNGFCRCTALNNYQPDSNTRFTSITASQGTDGSFISTTGTQSGFVSKWTTSITSNAGIINFGSGVTVVVSSVFLVACVLASLL